MLTVSSYYGKRFSDTALQTISKAGSPKKFTFGQPAEWNLHNFWMSRQTGIEFQEKSNAERPSHQVVNSSWNTGFWTGAMYDLWKRFFIIPIYQLFFDQQDENWATFVWLSQSD